MNLRETITVSIDALRANKLRALLTTLGVVIGSACIVLVVTVALTGRKFVIAQIEGIGSNLIWAELITPRGKPQPVDFELTTSDIQAIKEGIPGVVEAAGTRELPMAVVVNGVVRPVNLIGVTEGYQAIRRLVIIRGRFLDDLDMQTRAKVCLITQPLAELVFGLDNPVGKTLRMGELTFTVIGVFRERVATFGMTEIQKESVIIPLSLMKYYAETDVVRGLMASAARPEDVPAVQRQMLQLIRSRHPAEAEYSVDTLGSVLGAANGGAGAGDQRNRDHEHHAGDRERTHARNRRSQGHRRVAPRDSVPVSDGSVFDKRRRSTTRDSCGACRSRTEPALSARESSSPRFLGERGGRVCGVVFDRAVVRIFAGKQGGKASASGLAAV